ncbi:MAG: hypothetical protein ABI432_04495 [Flavobacteriales bacterium]
MRASLPLMILACTALGVAAQPTIMPSDMPTPGQSVVYRLFDTIPPLATGADAVWEIYGTGASADTVVFYSPVGQPGVADFPDATLMATMSLDPGYRSYFKTSATSFEYLGYHIVGVASFPDDPNAYLQFPCNYGNTWSDTWGPMDATIDVDLSADGWGTLVAAGTSWSNVLKVHGSSPELDTLVGGVHYQSFVTMDFFWRPGETFYVAYVHHRDYLVDGIPDGDITKTHVRITEELVTGTTDRARNGVVNAFPNPAEDVLHLATMWPDLTSIVLVDPTGREAAHEAIDTNEPPGTEHTLDVSGLAPGIYAVRCTGRAGNTACAMVMVH